MAQHGLRFGETPERRMVWHVWSPRHMARSLFTKLASCGHHDTFLRGTLLIVTGNLVADAAFPDGLPLRALCFSTSRIGDMDLD